MVGLCVLLRKNNLHNLLRWRLDVVARIVCITRDVEERFTRHNATFNYPSNGGKSNDNTRRGRFLQLDPLAVSCSRKSHGLMKIEASHAEWSKISREPVA